jgi:hypothetical protein
MNSVSLSISLFRLRASLLRASLLRASLLRSLLIGIVLCLVCGSSLYAQIGQRATYIAPNIGYDISNSRLFLGAQSFLEMSNSTSTSFGIAPSVDLYAIGSDPFALGLHAAAMFIFSRTEQTQPYASGGLGLVIGSGVTSGLLVNLTGGVRFMADSPIVPFAQVNMLIGSGSAFRLMGGVMFKI